MFDQAPVWKSGLTTQVTSLMARLRDSADAGDERNAIDESDLWAPPSNESTCCLAVLEIDGFNALVLDRGDDFATALLEAVEARLVRTISPSDTVTALARGQFAVILDRAASDEDAARCARTILRGFDDPVGAAGAQVRITASIGVATSAAWTSTGAMIGAALREVEAVKRNGGNGIKTAIPCRVHSSPAPPRYAILGNA